MANETNRYSSVVFCFNNEFYELNEFHAAC